jgi:hypothetical protein
MNKKLGIVLGVGCGVIIVLLVGVGILLVTFVPKIFNWAGEQIAAEQERQQLANSWQPPEAGGTSEEFFPPEVGGYELASHDEDLALPNFGSGLDGWHAEYKSDAGEIDVFVYQASDLEKEAVFRRVHDAYEDEGGGLKRITNAGYRCFYSSSKQGQYHFWWMQGWLLVFHTQDSEDREPFIMEFLRTTGGQSKADDPES